MPHVLVLYASKHGHTEKIASRIASAAEQAGADVDLLEVGKAALVSAEGYDTLVLGASIHAGKHQHEIVEWAKTHAATLSSKPSAFFSVSLTAADDTDEARATTQQYLDEFLELTGWTPTRTQTFAGSLQYLEYDFATRLVIRLMMKRSGRPTDTSHDHDYTDWDSVEVFGRECAEMATAPAPAAVR
jgi:menaquinone-dependent protoporphyrinogen oxidase